MKQYLTPEQTAKLIEMGFAPTVKIKEVRTVHTRVEIVHDCNFAIGELIEMLPPRYNHEDLEINRDWRFERWLVYYRGDDTTAATELVDALYDMVVKLKEEGVI
jgi:hypothetical protein